MKSYDVRLCQDTNGEYVGGAEALMGTGAAPQKKRAKEPKLYRCGQNIIVMKECTERQLLFHSGVMFYFFFLFSFFSVIHNREDSLYNGFEKVDTGKL